MSDHWKSLSVNRPSFIHCCLEFVQSEVREVGDSTNLVNRRQSSEASEIVVSRAVCVPSVFTVEDLRVKWSVCDSANLVNWMFVGSLQTEAVEVFCS